MVVKLKAAFLTSKEKEEIELARGWANEWDLLHALYHLNLALKERVQEANKYKSMETIDSYRSLRKLADGTNKKIDIYFNNPKYPDPTVLFRGKKWNDLSTLFMRLINPAGNILNERYYLGHINPLIWLLHNINLLLRLIHARQSKYAAIYIHNKEIKKKTPQERELPVDKNGLKDFVSDSKKMRRPVVDYSKTLDLIENILAKMK